MSGDLISKSTLMEDVRNNITECSGIMDWLNLIDRQPTAYNVDKVVEQLEEYSSGDVCSRFSGGCPYLNNPDVHCEHCAVMMAIDVVKAGGM